VTRRKPEPRRSAETTTIVIDSPRRGRIKAHVTITRYSTGEACEIFVATNKVGSDVRTSYEAWAITASYALQHGVPLRAIARAVLHVRDDWSGTLEDGRQVSSLWDAIGQLLEESCAS